MNDFDKALAAGDGTLHSALDYWQERALKPWSFIAQPVPTATINSTALDASELLNQCESFFSLHDDVKKNIVSELDAAIKAQPVAPVYELAAIVDSTCGSNLAVQVVTTSIALRNGTGLYVRAQSKHPKAHYD